jgi:cell wall-associated NlpC family hydrolase
MRGDISCSDVMYEWGATGPDAFDCSGLVTAVYAATAASYSFTIPESWRYDYNQ